MTAKEKRRHNKQEDMGRNWPELRSFAVYTPHWRRVHSGDILTTFYTILTSRNGIIGTDQVGIDVDERPMRAGTAVRNTTSMRLEGKEEVLCSTSC